MYVNSILAIGVFAALNSQCNSSPHHLEPNSTPGQLAVVNRETTDRQWKAATFEGLIIGKGTRTELINRLGKPVDSYDSGVELPKRSAGKETIDEFDYSGTLSGRVQVYSSKKTGVVSYLVLFPQDLSLSAIVDLFGKEYLITRYSFLVDPKDTGSSRLVEDPNGDLHFLEYRGRGIAVNFDVSNDKVKSVEFVHKSIGIPVP